MIIGNIASGKTTLSKIIEERYHIKRYSMDEIVYNEFNQKRSEEEQKNIINQIIQKEKDWIIEGMPRKNKDIIAFSSSTIIYLNYPKKLLKKRLRKRCIKQKLGIIKEPYQITKELYQKLLKDLEYYPEEEMKSWMLKNTRKGIIIKNAKEYKNLLKAIEKGTDL